MPTSRNYNHRQSPYYRKCPVSGCTRGYMIDRYRGCVDHRQEGERMWATGSHPERREASITQPRRTPASYGPPVPRPPASSKSKGHPFLVLLLVILALWWIGEFQDQNTPNQPLRPATVVADLDVDRGGGCGERSYINVDGDCVSGPVHAPSPPAGASARCEDGTYSFSRNRQGTCSHHGGVASWLP